MEQLVTKTERIKHFYQEHRTEIVQIAPLVVGAVFSLVTWNLWSFGVGFVGGNILILVDWNDNRNQNSSETGENSEISTATEES